MRACARRWLAGLLAVGCWAAPVAALDDPLLHLAIGDPSRRDREMPVVLDAITDAQNSGPMGPPALAARLADTRLLLVGETHTSVESHRVQLQLLDALAATGRPVLVGLEMFPYTEQASLDAWTAGRWTEEQFVTRSEWYEHWGYRWQHYREIFLFTREAGMPLVALNVPREVVSAVRRKGIEGLSREEVAHLPPAIDTDSAEHLTFLKASFADGDSVHGSLSESAWKAMLAAQATWDAGMAWRAVQALESAGPRAILVVLAGSGHVAYGVGIERQARAWFDGPIASLIPVPVADEEGPVTAVGASYATFVWGVAHEAWPAYPSLGVSTRAAGGSREVFAVEPDSPAAEAGVAVGDTILAVDGLAVADRAALNEALSRYRWSDVLQLTVRRDGTELVLPVALRRKP